MLMDVWTKVCVGGFSLEVYNLVLLTLHFPSANTILSILSINKNSSITMYTSPHYHDQLDS